VASPTLETPQSPLQMLPAESVKKLDQIIQVGDSAQRPSLGDERPPFLTRRDVELLYQGCNPCDRLKNKGQT
jgi:hypothetical protein